MVTWQLICDTPDMSEMLCDGCVLVEACVADGGKELWTSDEVAPTSYFVHPTSYL